jgi:hypothetical protein
VATILLGGCLFVIYFAYRLGDGNAGEENERLMESKYEKTERGSTDISRSVLC